MCRVAVHGRCRASPWLIEFSGAAQSCFTLSRSASFKLTSETGGLAHSTVQGSSLFIVIGEKNSEHYNGAMSEIYVEVSDMEGRGGGVQVNGGGGCQVND